MTKTLTDPELDRAVATLSALDADATPAPWMKDVLGLVVATRDAVVRSGILNDGSIAGVLNDADQDLIVCMRNALPQLLAALQRTRKELAEARLNIKFLTETIERAAEASPTGPAHRFRLKHGEVQARQWDGTNRNAAHIVDWICSVGGTAYLRCHDTRACLRNLGNGPHWIAVETPAGTSNTVPSEWIFRTVDGQFHVGTADFFEETYTPIGEPS